MTIRIYTGLNGSGKTLHCIQDIENYHKEFPNARIFTNITKLAFDYCEPLPASLNWQDTPNGSLVIYDEAQRDELFPATGTATLSNDPRIKGIAEHRKTEHDIWFITPFGTGLHFQVRKYCREHYHLYNPVGLSASTVCYWERFSNNPEDYFELQKADSRMWKWPKNLFEKYESAQSHKKKKLRIPLKVIVVLSGILLVAFLIGWAWWSGKIFFLPSPNSDKPVEVLGYDGKPKNKESTSFIAGLTGQKATMAYQDRFMPEVPHMPWTAPEYSDLKAQTVPQLFCFIGSSCKCFSEQMTRIQVPDSICRDIVINGLYNPFIPTYQASSSSPSSPLSSPSASSSSLDPSSSSASSSASLVPQIHSYGSFRGKP